MFRVTVEPDAEGSVVRMAGRLAADYLEEARQVCFTDKPHLLLDASELRDADADGIAFLATFLDRGGRVEGLREGRSG